MGIISCRIFVAYRLIRKKRKKSLHFLGPCWCVNARTVMPCGMTDNIDYLSRVEMLLPNVPRYSPEALIICWLSMYIALPSGLYALTGPVKTDIPTMHQWLKTSELVINIISVRPARISTVADPGSTGSHPLPKKKIDNFIYTLCTNYQSYDELISSKRLESLI